MITIRRAEVGDAGAIAEVHVQAWRQAYAGIVPQEYLDRLDISDRTRVWQRLLSAGAEVWVAEDRADGSGARVIGWASSGPARTGPDGQPEENLTPPRPLELYAIYLLAEFYGTGTGSRLLQAAIGDRPAYLWVLQQNARAIAFYRRVGFEADGITMPVPGMDGIVEIRMVR